MSRRSKVLLLVFGALASVTAAFTVLLYWMVRRDRPGLNTPPPPPVADPGSSSNDGCPSCGDSCGSAASDMCDDVFKNVCQQPMEDVCGGTLNTCSSGNGSCDTGSTTCDTSQSNCANTVTGSHLFQMLAGGQVWMSTASARPRDRVTLPARVGISVIRAYQRHVSQRLGTHCRYSPSCSEYGVEALRRYGALDGAMLTVARIRRCTVTVPFGTLDPA